MSPPAIRHLARQLLAGDPGRAESDTDANRTVRVCEKLRVPLSRLAGTAGYASLLTRALALANRQEPALQRLRVEPDGALSASDSEVSPDFRGANIPLGAGTLLVAELLSLLIALIGKPLTLTLVREAWPDASIEDLTLRTEETP